MCRPKSLSGMILLPSEFLFNISYSASLQDINSQFVFEKSFIFERFFFFWYRLWGYQFFPFQHFKWLCNFWQDSCYNSYLCTPVTCALKLFSLPFFSSLSMLCLGVFILVRFVLWFILLGILWGFWICSLMFFIKKIYWALSLQTVWYCPITLMPCYFGFFPFFFLFVFQLG